MPAGAVGPSGSFRGALAVSTVLAAILTSCAVRPSELLVGLSIVPDVASLHIGESTLMTVLQRYADGTSREISANWALIGGALRQEGPGRFVGASNGLATVRATFDGNAVERQVAVVQDLRGEWSGILHHLKCNRVSGEGPSHCGKNRDGTFYRVTMSAGEQRGGAFFSTIGVRDNAKGAFSGSIDVNGVVSMADGAAHFRHDVGDYYYRLRQWKLVADRSPEGALRLTGTVQLEHDFVNAWGRQIHLEDATIILEKE